MSVVAGLPDINSRGRVTEAHDGFCLDGKALIVDSQSVLVALPEVPLPSVPL